MRVDQRNQVEQVKLTQSGKMIHPNNQEMPTKLQREEYIMQIGQELLLFN
jgi:DNA primase